MIKRLIQYLKNLFRRPTSQEQTTPQTQQESKEIFKKKVLAYARANPEPLTNKEKRIAYLWTKGYTQKPSYKKVPAIHLFNVAGRQIKDVERYLSKKLNTG